MIGMKLSQYLTDTKETDAAFAAKVGLSQSQISRLRRGLSNPSWDVVPVIEKVTKGAVTAADFAPKLKRGVAA